MHIHIDEVFGEIQRAVLLRDGVVIDGPFMIDSGKQNLAPEGCVLIVVQPETRVQEGYSYDEALGIFTPPVVVEEP